MRRRDLPLLFLPAVESPRLINALGRQWRVPIVEDWEPSAELLRLKVERPPKPENPRRPTQYALLDEPAVERFRLQVDVQRDDSKKNTAVIIVYAWQNEGRFNYIHLCQESAPSQPRHNGIFHVFDGERVRISPVVGEGVLPDGAWHHVDTRWDGRSGVVEVRVDGRPHPALRAVDVSLTRGQVGLGSFFNTGSFRRFSLQE